MAPRVKLLIIVGIIIYVSLSLYHWRQVKKIPGKVKQNGVHSVLTRESHEKNWVQVSTSPDQSVENKRSIAPAVSQEKLTVPPEQPVPLSVEKDEPEGLSGKDLQAVASEDKEIEKELEHERTINRQQSERLQELHTQVITLQSALEDSTIRIQEKDRALEELQKLSSAHAAEKKVSKSDQDRIQALKISLGSKIDALSKANERIAGLSDRLDQTRDTLAELHSNHAHLQSVLSLTENTKIAASQKAETLHTELVQTREERDKYLAETGRLHTELKQTRTRLAHLENELKRMQLETEAMLRYGQQQTALVTPFMQEIDLLQARVEDKNRELLKAEDNAYQILDQHQALNKEILSLRLELQKNATIDKELKNTSQHLDNERKHSSELTEQLKELATQLNSRDEKISGLQAELIGAQDNFQKAKQESSLLQDKKEQQQKKLETFSQELAELRQELGSVKSDQLKTESELTQALLAKDQLNIQLSDSEQLLEKIKTESAQLSLQLEEKNKQLAAAKEPPETTSGPGQQTPPETGPVPDEENLRKLKLALEAAEKRLAETEPEIQRLKQSLAAAEQKQADDKTVSNLKKEIEQLNISLDDKSALQKETEQLATELKDENLKLKTKISEAENTLAKTQELKSTLDQKSNELSENQKHINRLQDEVSGLKTELDRRETAFFSMQEDYASLQDQNNTLQEERDSLVLYTLDNDNDSVSDAQDSCPETVAGAKVGPDGCELDHDRDGLVDRLDLCPGSSEGTDTDPLGCAQKESIVLTGLYFSGGNAELSPASQSYLDKVAAILDLTSDIHLEIGGHTDSIGDVDRNLKVSQQRAEAVIGYLVEQGIDNNRLVPVGYGSEQPVADNATAEGRAANRRVEIKIIPSGDHTTTDNVEEPTEDEVKEGLPVQ